MSEDLLERKRAETSGGELSFVDHGEGPALVLLHGFPTSCVIWDEFVPILGMSMRVIAPDLLGYGESAKPAGADLSVGAQTRYVRELLVSQGIEEFAVCGHDLGGGVAQLLALGGGVRTLVLIDSIAFEPPALPAEDRPGPFIDVWLARAALHPARLTDGFRAELLAPFAGDDGAEALRRAAGALARSGLPDESELASIDVPTLLVWGEDDPLNPVAIAERLNEALFASTLALLPGCSHLLTHEAPETVGGLLHEYLRSRYLGAGHAHAEPGGPVPIALTRRPDRT